MPTAIPDVASPSLTWRSPKTAVQPSRIHGRGLFAVEPIAKDEIVVIKGGYVFDARELIAVAEELGPAEIQVADGFFIGPRRLHERDGGMIFSNHSCEPNIGVAGQIVFVALRDIAAGEELTHDWATTDDDTYEVECRCGTSSCLGVLTGQDWRKPELQARYGEHMSWYLRRKIERRA